MGRVALGNRLVIVPDVLEQLRGKSGHLQEPTALCHEIREGSVPKKSTIRIPHTHPLSLRRLAGDLDAAEPAHVKETPDADFASPERRLDRLKRG